MGVDEMKVKIELYRQMLKDVITAPDLSDEMIQRHGPLGTPPAKLVL